MIAGTHVAFSTVLYLGGAALFEYQPSITGWSVAALASVLPDIDLPTSKVGRVFYWLSTKLEKDFGHRTVTHSAVALVALAIILLPVKLLGLNAVYWAFLGGWWSHIFIDMTNPRGSDLLWPSPLRFVMPGDIKSRIETGSKAEMVLMLALIGFSILLYPVAGMGLRAGLQHFLGSFDMALTQFQKQQGKEWFKLELKAIDNLTLEEVKGTYDVLGIWNDGIIVMQGGRPRAVGESQTNHNLYPTVAKLIDGPPLDVVSEHVDMRGKTLRWLLKHIDTSRTYFILGEMLVAGRFENLAEIDTYHAAQFTGGVLKLHYAREADLDRYLDLPAAEGEMYVQYWLHEGDQAVEMTLADKKRESLIPEQLRKYL